MSDRKKGTASDWVRRAQPGEGIERIEAWFGGKAYGMHRHDTYAIGRTLAGFADQSHMTRQFTRAYGMPPARWRTIARGVGPRSASARSFKTRAPGGR
ncbi:AraC family transcriptional regulator [Caballeronia ptereochthonis]|uniref:AraC family transcriptional regulator n=1 Tax=Caballeronia ptereochthonis TaxID=1777144 RepID=A0A158C0W3_9BURK|nr:AraC family transcriptional regulator [Caballeronia ptereochthonis]